MPHLYSSFWLTFGNGAPLSPIWSWKDRAGAAFEQVVHPLEELSMHDWLALSNGEQVAVVGEYAGRTPRQGGAGDVRKRGGRE